MVSSDRGLCGAYNANVLRRSEELFSLLREEGKKPVLYTVGRKALGYYSFRGRDVTESWTGFSERPDLRERAGDRGRPSSTAFMAGADDEGDDPGEDGILGVDELHIVFTEFKSMLSQTAEARRIAPMVVEYVGEPEEGPHTLFSFEPDPETLFDALLPRYVATRVYSALLEAAASEIGVAPPGDEVGHRQRRRPDQGAHAGGQPRTPGPDHPGNQRDRRWRKRARRRQVSPVGSEEEK